MPPRPAYERIDELDPLPYAEEWPSLRSGWGRVDIHSLAAYWLQESKISGHYLEFGVGAGRSAVAAIRANRRVSPPRIGRYFLFDSFAGLPPLAGPDEGSPQFTAGDFAFSVDQVAAKLQKHGVTDDADVVLVPGFFEDSLPTFDPAELRGGRAAIVHIDVDLYGSAAAALAFLTPYVQPGAMFLFDDWNCFAAQNDKGERRAAREWLGRQPGFRLESYAKYGWHGEAFILDC
jgi:hypothetical protein